MRQITDQDIKDAFLILINQNGTTSTKEVKEYLRSEGFWVFQSQVSQVINDSFQSLNTERVSNGIYFEYSLVEVDDTDDDEFSPRQLRFRKDSNIELISKFKNPKYIQFKSDIQSILDKRGVTV